MPPTQSTVTPAPTSTPSAEPPTHHPSIPALVVLALFLSMMAALAIGVILRQRHAMASLNHTHTQARLHEKRRPAPARWLSRFIKSRQLPAAKTDGDDPTAVGALHATSVLLAAAPCHVFSSPMTMHFRIPLQDKTVLVLGAPWFPVPGCGAQYCSCGTPAVRIEPLSHQDLVA